MTSFTDNITSIDDVLEIDLLSTAAATTAAGVSKRNYQSLTAFRNVLTHSTRAKLHECPRKWQFMKMIADSEDGSYEAGREANVHFAFGHAIGAGIATYDETLDIDAAIFAAFLAWDIDLLAVGKKKQGGKIVDSMKTFPSVVWALKTYGLFRTEETDLDDYEVVENEATLLIDWEDGFFDSLHVDSILRHKTTGKYKVKENKSSGLSTMDAAMYSNGEQALGYSVAVDMLPDAGQEFDVIYMIYLTEEQRWVSYEFPKSSLAKVEWVQEQLNLHQDINRATEQKFFPKRGEACWSFGGRCHYYESCGDKVQRIFGKEFSDLKTATVEDLEQLETYKHKTTLTEILARQKEKVLGAPAGVESQRPRVVPIHLQREQQSQPQLDEDRMENL